MTPALPAQVLSGALGALRPARLDGVRVDGARLLRPDGTAVVVVETDDLDLPALDESRRTAVEAAFTRLCRILQTSLQVLVQVRRWVDVAPVPPGTVPVAPGGGITDRLLHASADHRAESLAERPAYRRRVFLLVSCAGDDPRGLSTAERSVVDALAAAGIAGHTLDAADLEQLVAEAWDGPVPRAPRGDVMRPAWRETATHLVSGGLLLRGVVLRRFPGVPVSPGWLAPLLLTAADCDIAIHVHPVPVAHAVAGLNRRLRMMRADQLVDLERDGVGNAIVEAGVDGALDLRARLARNEGRSVRISVTAVARARTVSALDAATAALRLGFGAMLAEGEPTHLRHHDAALTCWPLGDDRAAGSKLADTAAAATCTPWVEALCDDRHGYALGRATVTGSPVRLDPFDTARQANANIAVLASSGHGKSYLLGTVLLEAVARGVGAVVVDPEGEYGHLVRALGGEHVSLAPGSGAAINVFDAGCVDDADDDRRAEVTGAVVDLASVLCGGLDDVERAHVDAAAGAALDGAAGEGRTAVLADCLTGLGAAPRVGLVLRRFCSGPLGDLFSRPTTVRLDATVVGISLRDLRDELVPAATLVVAEWLWALVRRDRRRRHLVFDEVGLLCAHAPLRRLLTQLARRCRKYHASLVVATQNATDLLASEEGRVIASNPAITLLGGHRGAETALMQSAYSLTDAQRRSLEAAARGEFLLLAGARRLGVRIETPPLHHALLTGGAPG